MLDDEDRTQIDIETLSPRRHQQQSISLSLLFFRILDVQSFAIEATVLQGVRRERAVASSKLV